MTKQSGPDPAVCSQVMQILSRHIGAAKAIGMDALHERVFGEAPGSKINGTRRLRRVIEHLRLEGNPICSTNRGGGGYYLPATNSELDDYLGRDKRRALRVLHKIARMKKIGLFELLGQMQLSLTGGVDDSD